jgi:hypothetical protein
MEGTRTSLQAIAIQMRKPHTEDKRRRGCCSAVQRPNHPLQDTGR